LVGSTSLLPAEVAKLGLRIDLANDQEHTQDSRELILSVCRLMGPVAPLVLCFDHLDALAHGPKSGPLLRELVSAIDVLHDQPGSTKLLVTSAVASAQDQLKSVAGSGASASGEGSALWARLAEHRVSLPTLTWEEAAALTLQRLESNPTLAALRAGQREPFWPLVEQRLRQRYEQLRLTCTPRAWINVCHLEFIGSPPPPPSPPLAKRFEYHRGQVPPDKADVQDDLLLDVLPWLAHVLEPALKGTGGPTSSPRLLFRSSAKAPACAVHWFPKLPHWKTFDAFHKKWQPKELPQLLVLFGGQETDLTPALQSRVTKLREAGAETLFLAPEQLLGLQALRELLREVRAGAQHLAGDGQPVSEEQLAAWVRKEVAEGPPTVLAPLKEFCWEVFAHLKPGEKSAPSGHSRPAGVTRS
jgi:hypothetical protein